MKFYARMVQEDEEDELIVFFLPVERLFQLREICTQNGLSEAVITMPTYVRIPWPEDLPADGFISAETRQEWEAGAFEDIAFDPDHASVDLSQSLLEALHVGVNGAIHIELRGGPAGEWWSEGLNLEEIARHLEL